MAHQKGQFIKVSTANSEINEYLKIRDESYAVINAALSVAGASSDSTTYFSEEKTSFFFEKSLLLQLFGEVEEANGLRIYYAGQPTKGYTTLVLVAVKIDTDDETGEITKVVNVFSQNEDHAALEYPGGGKKKVNSPTPIDILNDNIVPPNII